MTRHFTPPPPIVCECDGCGKKEQGNPPIGWLYLQVFEATGSNPAAAAAPPIIDLCPVCRDAAFRGLQELARLARG